MASRITTYEAFWPFYLREHSKPATRIVHFVGTNWAVIALISAAALRDWRFLLSAVVGAYGAAWISHFFIEKNRPATFQYPWWSLISDFKMWALMWTGRIGAEVERHVQGARPSSASAA